MSVNTGLKIAGMADTSSTSSSQGGELAETCKKLYLALLDTDEDGLITQKCKVQQKIVEWMKKANTDPQMAYVSNVFLFANQKRGEETLKRLAKQVRGGLSGVSDTGVNLQTLSFSEIVRKLEATKKKGVTEQGLEAAFAFCLGSGDGSEKIINFVQKEVNNTAL